MLKIPAKFNRNNPKVRAMGTPAETGRLLIDYMCERIGLPDLDGKDLIDFGCGVRFSESLVNLGLPVKSYTGLDVHSELIAFLQKEVTDPRFAYHHVNAANLLYNPDGVATDPYENVPLDTPQFDIASMFSVITHQDPTESAATFRFLRRVIRPDGCMFFSAFLHEDDEPFRELKPEHPGLQSSYSLAHLSTILKIAGWEILSVERINPRGLPIAPSLLCKPLSEV